MSYPRLATLALLVLPACGSSEVKRDCEAAVARYRRPSPEAEAALAQELAKPDVPAGHHARARAVAERATRHNQRVAQLLFTRCTEDRWNSAMRTCVANDDPGCPDLLPPAQFRKFDEAFTALNTELAAEKKADRDPWNAGRGTTCGQATESMARVAGANEGMRAREFAFGASRACMTWHFTAVNCFGDATTAAEMTACEQYLTPAQQAALREVLEPSAE